MLEYAPEELADLYRRAIEGMASDGIISPADYKHYMANIDKWLNEELRD